MYILVTDPEAMAKGRLAKTFYCVPESVGEMLRLNEYGAWVEEAETLKTSNPFAAGQARQKALNILFKIWQDTPSADCVDVVELLKPNFRLSRIYALRMVSKLFRGAATQAELTAFKETPLRRLQTARYKFKNLRDKAGERWALNLDKGFTS